MAKDAKELQRQAGEMAKGLTPEKREELSRLAQRMAAERDRAQPASREPIDASSEQRKRFSAADGRSKPLGDEAKGSIPIEPPRGRSAVLDARRGKPSGAAGPARTLAEWQGEGGTVSTEDSAALRETINSAAESAQRAVERQQVPRQLEGLVQRWYKRLPQAAGAKPPDAPPEGEKK